VPAPIKKTRIEAFELNVSRKFTSAAAAKIIDP
jgi:hypothetical protein